MSELDEYKFNDLCFDYVEKNEVINMNNNLTNYTNYWHKNTNSNSNSNSNNNSSNKIINQKPLTYDDILNSLNLKAQNGNLEFIEKKEPIINGKKQNRVTFNANIESKNIINVEKQSTPTPTPTPKPLPISNTDKNSYIYNKYFKNYKDESLIEEQKKPMTREEYIKEYNRKVYEKKRIEEFKSKKLLFSKNNVNISVRNSNHTLNKMTFM